MKAMSDRRKPRNGAAAAGMYAPSAAGTAGTPRGVDRRKSYRA